MDLQLDEGGGVPFQIIKTFHDAFQSSGQERDDIMENQEESNDAADRAAALEGEVETKVSSGKKSGLWKLYISRALTAWGDRLWSFGLGLFLLHVRTFQTER